jgi:hypothetical protein
MPRILHLVKDPANRTPLAVIAEQAKVPGNELGIVLMQAATTLRDPLPGQVYQLGDGHESPYPAIDHSRLLDLIFAADTVVTW